MIARALGARPIAVDIDSAKLDLAVELGATATINAATEDLAANIADLTDGGAHCSIEAAGTPATAHASIRCLRPRGRHVQVGLMTGESAHSSIPFDRVVAHELELYGSHGMPAHAYPELIHLISKGTLNPSLLTGRTTSLETGLAALVSEQAFSEPGILVINQI